MFDGVEDELGLGEGAGRGVDEDHDGFSIVGVGFLEALGDFVGAG